jgi:hypothetical protein
MACGGGGGGDTTTTGDQPETASIQLELTTVGGSGNTYRLGPATFDISDGSETITVEATGAEPALNVPVEPGFYEVTLHDGWVLQLVDPEGGSTPLAATLLSQPVQGVSVNPFITAPLFFDFHLGVSGIDIGINVDEGEVPPGFDGAVIFLGENQFMVSFPNGGGICCFGSVTEAVEAFPELTLFVGGI